MQEPGLDRHEWESEWASLEEGFADDPAGSLRLAHGLIRRMLEEREILDDSVAAPETADPELLRPYEAGAELVRKLDEGLEIDEVDIRETLESYRELFQTLSSERAA
jgi:hypothetical protein